MKATGICECGNEFTRYNSITKRCVKCAIIKAKQDRIAKDKQDKEERIHYRKKKKEQKNLPWYQANAQKAMNAYARERDHDLPCISCGSVHTHTKLGGTYDGGHYRSVGSSRGTRYLLHNINKQCKYCNDRLDGNPIGYRKGLVEKIGEDAVFALEYDHKERLYTKEQLERMGVLFRKKTRILRKRRA